MSAGDTPVNSPEIQRLARVIEPGHSYATVTDKIASIVLTRPTSIGWLAGFSIAFTLMMVLVGSIAWLITKGVGIWGINIPIGWGFAIVNFVWWIGIGHAGTLIWDVFAVATYGTVSALFWFVGLIPDLATLRDRATNKAAQIIYGMLAMGWRGSARHWHRYQSAYLLLAGLATPLVLSVHTVV